MAEKQFSGESRWQDYEAWWKEKQGNSIDPLVTGYHCSNGTLVVMYEETIKLKSRE